jgi:hypothetical protein
MRPNGWAGRRTRVVTGRELSREPQRHVLPRRVRRDVARVLTYVNAGHNSPILFRQTGTGLDVVRLETGGPVIGLIEDCVYRQDSGCTRDNDLKSSMRYAGSPLHQRASDNHRNFIDRDFGRLAPRVHTADRRRR